MNSALNPASSFKVAEFRSALPYQAAVAASLFVLY
jgi:hypothetical protein